MKIKVLQLLLLTSFLLPAFSYMAYCQVDKIVVGGLIPSEVVLPDKTFEPITVGWNHEHIYYLYGPDGIGVTQSLEFFDPSGQSISNINGILTSVLNLPGGDMDYIKVAWTDQHIYYLGGPVGGNMSCIEYLDMNEQPISNTKAVIESWVDLPSGSEPVRIAWNDQCIYYLGGPIGGMTSCIEYQDPNNQSIINTRGIVNGWIYLPEGTWEHIKVAWNEEHIYYLGGPIGGVTTSIEYLDAQGLPINNTLGIIAGEIYLEKGHTEPVLVAWSDNHVYSLVGPVGENTAVIEYLDVNGFPIANTRGVITSHVDLPGGGQEPIIVVWNNTHIYCIMGPVGGSTTCIEYLDPIGQPIPNTLGIIASEVTLTNGNTEAILVAWNDEHVYYLGGPIGGNTSCIEYSDPDDQPIINTNGVIGSEVELPGGAQEHIQVAWNDDHVYALGGPVGGNTSCVEYLDPQGQSIPNIKGITLGWADDIKIAWNDDHIYCLGGPVGGITSCIEYFDPYDQQISGTLGIMTSHVELQRIPVAMTNNHIYYLGGPVNNICWSYEYYDPLWQPIQLNATQIESFLHTSEYNGAGVTGTGNLKSFFVGQTDGAVYLNNNAGDTWCTVISGRYSHILIGSPAITILNEEYIDAASGWYISGTSMILLGYSVTGKQDLLAGDQAKFRLWSYPNPVVTSVTIGYSLPYSEFITIKLFDVIGNEIKTLVQGMKPQGQYTVGIDNKFLPSGIYYCQMTTPQLTKSLKLIVL
jgi:hypothetical protein